MLSTIIIIINPKFIGVFSSLGPVKMSVDLIKRGGDGKMSDSSIWDFLSKLDET